MSMWSRINAVLFGAIIAAESMRPSAVTPILTTGKIRKQPEPRTRVLTKRQRKALNRAKMRVETLRRQRKARKALRMAGKNDATRLNCLSAMATRHGFHVFHFLDWMTDKVNWKKTKALPDNNKLLRNDKGRLRPLRRLNTTKFRNVTRRRFDKLIKHFPTMHNITFLII